MCPNHGSGLISWVTACTATDTPWRSDPGDSSPVKYQGVPSTTPPAVMIGVISTPFSSGTRYGRASVKKPPPPATAAGPAGRSSAAASTATMIRTLMETLPLLGPSPGPSAQDATPAPGFRQRLTIYRRQAYRPAVLAAC